MDIDLEDISMHFPLVFFAIAFNGAILDTVELTIRQNKLN
jgi:hypothetical protein